MSLIDVLNADKWRAAVRDFDAKRAAFATALAEITAATGATAALESERAALIAKANPLRVQIDALHGGLKAVRDFLAKLAGVFSFGGVAPASLGGLGVAPLVVGGVTIAGIAVIANAVGNWLAASAAWRGKNELAATLARQGATPKQIADAVSRTAKTEPELFGFKVGGLKWVAIIAGIIIAGPYMVRGMEKFRIGRMLR